MDNVRDGSKSHDLDAQSLAGHHVFAWVGGFGWTVMPFAPYRFERVGDQGLRVEHHTPSGVKAATLAISGSGYDVTLDSGTSSLGEVAEVFAGPEWDGWRIDSEALHCDWPQGFAFVSLPGTTPPLFEWIAADEARIWLQGPVPAASLPSPHRMSSPDQRVDQITPLTHGPLVELTYEHENRPWRMFHAVHCPGGLPESRRLLRWLKPKNAASGYALIVSGQTPEEHAVLTRAAVIEIAESLTPAPPEQP